MTTTDSRLCVMGDTDISSGAPKTAAGGSTPIETMSHDTQRINISACDHDAAGIVPSRTRSLRSLAGLPNELLVEIWSYLCLLDRANVINVCRHWRSCAITAPCLWTSLEILCSTPFQGERNCLCTTCSDERSRFSSNLIRMPTLALLGKNLPLSITIRADVYWVCEVFVSGLIELLQQHASRIEELYVFGEFYLEPFFRRITSFPALRVLSVAGEEDAVENPFQKTLFSNQISLPVLEVLEICRTLLWCTSLDIFLPRVHTLSLSVYCQEELASALRACQNITTLSIAPNFCGDMEWDVNLVARLHQMPKLRIIDMTVSFDQWFCDHFTSAPGTDIDVVYFMHGPRWTLDVLAEFQGEVYVACAEHTLTFRDASRRLLLSQPNTFEFNRWHIPWSKLPLNSLVALDVPAPQWWSFLSQAPLLPSVTAVTLRVASAAEVDRVADKHADLGPILPALDVLCIQGAQTTLPSPRVAKLVRRLTGNLPLRVLELKDARISDESDLPADIALCVRVH